MKIAATALALAMTAVLVLGVSAASFGFLNLDSQVQFYIFLAAALPAALLWIRVLIHWRRNSDARDGLRSERQ